MSQSIIISTLILFLGIFGNTLIPKKFFKLEFGITIPENSKSISLAVKTKTSDNSLAEYKIIFLFFFFIFHKNL